MRDVPETGSGSERQVQNLQPVQAAAFNAVHVVQFPLANHPASSLQDGRNSELDPLVSQDLPKNHCLHHPPHVQAAPARTCQLRFEETSRSCGRRWSRSGVAHPRPRMFFGSLGYPRELPVDKVFTLRNLSKGQFCSVSLVIRVGFRPISLIKLHTTNPLKICTVRQLSSKARFIIKDTSCTRRTINANVRGIVE